MRLLGSSYNGDRRERQPQSAALSFATLCLAVTLGGCSGFGLPFGDYGLDRQLSTGSIHTVSAKGSPRVDQSDWETVRQVIASADTKRQSTQSLDWSNPDTGTTGTITIFDTISATNDQKCRNFATTINDARGIRRYRGEACLMTNDRWQLFGVLADDSKLL